MSETEPWLPLRRKEYKHFVDRFCHVLQVHADTIGVPPIQLEKTISLLGDFNAAFEANDTPGSRNRTTAQVEKQMRQLLTEQVRHIRWDYIEPAHHNKIVSDELYLQFGLVINNAKPGPRPDPTDHASYDLSVDGISHIVTADYRITGSEHRGKGIFHGVEARFWVLDPDAPPPTDANFPGWKSEISTATPWVRTFTAAEIGKKLYITMRWENESVGKDGTRGKGPWGEISSILIA
jgi:hypothetical protein